MAQEFLVIVLIDYGGLIASGSARQIEKPATDFSKAGIVVEYVIAYRADYRPAVCHLFPIGQVGSRVRATLVWIILPPGAAA
jgi:hypothetical protein